MASISVQLPAKTFFVGSWAPLKVDIDPHSGRQINEFELSIPSGTAGGLVSLGRGRTDNQQPVLLVGSQPGIHVLRVVDKADASLVDEIAYKIVGTGQARRAGPSLWFGGRAGVPVARPQPI